MSQFIQLALVLRETHPTELTTYLPRLLLHDKEILRKIFDTKNSYLNQLPCFQKLSEKKILLARKESAPSTRQRIIQVYWRPDHTVQKKAISELLIWNAAAQICTRKKSSVYKSYIQWAKFFVWCDATYYILTSAYTC